MDSLAIDFKVRFRKTIDHAEAHEDSYSWKKVYGSSSGKDSVEEYSGKQKANCFFLESYPQKKWLALYSPDNPPLSCDSYDSSPALIKYDHYRVKPVCYCIHKGNHPELWEERVLRNESASSLIFWSCWQSITDTKTSVKPEPLLELAVKVFRDVLGFDLSRHQIIDMLVNRTELNLAKAVKISEMEKQQ